MTLSSFWEGVSVVNDTGSTRVVASWTCLFNMHFASKVTKFWRQVFLLRVTWWWRGATCTVQRVRQQVHCCVEETCSWTPGRATFPIYASQWRSLLTSPSTDAFFRLLHHLLPDEGEVSLLDRADSDPVPWHFGWRL